MSATFLCPYLKKKVKIHRSHKRAGKSGEIKLCSSLQVRCWSSRLEAVEMCLKGESSKSRDQDYWCRPVDAGTICQFLCLVRYKTEPRIVLFYKVKIVHKSKFMVCASNPRCVCMRVSVFVCILGSSKEILWGINYWLLMTFHKTMCAYV